MINNIYLYGLGALIISVITQYLVIDVSHKRGIFIDDHTSELPQKLHESPTPRIGGLGIFLALLFMVADREIGMYLLIASVPAFIAGFLEDLFANISPIKRLLIMSGSGILVILFAQAYVTDFGIFHAPKFIGILITFIAITGLINGTNLVDGFNGLSSGISMIIFATYFFTALKVGDQSIALVSLVAFCAIAGFYILNYPKGKIFLGDGGAYTIGFLLAVVSILIVKRNNDADGYISPFFALQTLFYIVYEVIFSFSRRIAKGLSPLYPDRNHLHQFVFRNLTLHNNPLTSLTIYPLVILFNVLAYIYHDNTTVLLFCTLAYCLIYTITYLLLQKLDTKNN